MIKALAPYVPASKAKEAVNNTIMPMEVYFERSPEGQKCKIAVSVFAQ